MLATDIAESLHSPAARVGIGVIACLLVLVLVREVRRIPARLLVLMATAFLDMVGLLMIVPLLPFYVERLAGDGVNVFGVTLGTGTLSGIVISTFTVGQMISAPLWGRRSDRWGRRPVLLIALGASALAYLVFGFADSLWLLMLSRLVQGAGGGTVGVIQAYVADSIEPEQRARALGWLSAATNLGVALGPVLGSWAFSIRDVDLMPGPGTLAMGNAAPGILASALCLCTLGLAARYLKESNKSASTPAAGTPVRTSTRSAVIRVVARPHEPASRLILTYGIAIGAFQGINAVLPLFLKQRFQVNEHTIGYFFMYIGAIAVFARVLVLGRLVDRMGEAKLSRVGIVTLASGLFAMPFAGSLGTLALAVAMLPLGTAFTFPCVTSLLSRVVAGADRGLYMGLQQTYGGFARLLAPIFYGWAFDHLGIAVPFYFSAAFVLATILLGFGLDRFVGTRKPSS
ncbi:MAG TPA: MFS transporter [Planctomycetota bacterium]|nr:MFS transporter [Planctomycetota bacterium]